MTTATGTHTEFAGQGTTPDGYTFLAFSSGTAGRRRLWWHCGACWTEAPRKVKSMKTLNHQYQQHIRFCTGKPAVVAYLHVGIHQAA